MKLTGLIFTMLLAIGLFSSMYLYLNQSVISSGVTVNSNYSSVYGNISSESSALSTNINEISDAVKNVSEAGTLYQVAINGFKGLGAILKLPLSFLNNAIHLYEGLLTFLPIPNWAKVLISTGIIAGIIFLIIALLKGDQDKM